MQKKKILVTGGAGFIGSHLCDILVNENYKVVVIDNLSLGKKENIANLIDNKSFKFYTEDILNKKELNKIFEKEKFDEVYHFAANSDIAKSSKNPEIDLDNTFLTTYHVLEHMRTYRVNKIIFPSSSAIYGDTLSLIHEDYGPLKPLSHYGAGKLASEAFISSYIENYKIQGWVIRFPNVVGERATHGVVFDFFRKIKENPKKLLVLGDGNQNKPYVYVKDLIEGILFIRKKAKDQLNVFNLCPDDRVTVKEIVSLFLKNTGLKGVDISFSNTKAGWIGDVPEYQYSCEKLKRLGWTIIRSSRDAIDTSIKKILEL